MADRVPLLEIGKLHARVGELKAKKGAPPWSEAVVLTETRVTPVLEQHHDG